MMVQDASQAPGLRRQKTGYGSTFFFMDTVTASTRFFT